MIAGDVLEPVSEHVLDFSFSVTTESFAHDSEAA